ncbi:MAG: pepsin-like aspartyl protease [Candidatus Micrarchaeota archaeon]
MSFLFRFRKDRVEDGWVSRPKIKITLIHQNKSKEVIAVLDTGSDLVFIPAEIAEYFDLALSEKELIAQGIETNFSYKTAKIQIKLENPHNSYKKSVSVMVPAKETMHRDVILGSEFLKDFSVLFDYPNETVKLTQKTKK